VQVGKRCGARCGRGAAAMASSQRGNILGEDGEEARTDYAAVVALRPLLLLRR